MLPTSRTSSLLGFESPYELQECHGLGVQRLVETGDARKASLRLGELSLGNTANHARREEQHPYQGLCLGRSRRRDDLDA